ncbi:alkaline phosphatase [Limnobacter sp.]|uniref:alkaline phosphatase D family protein n=1 Tax=Limnobacter sp. TaxID=2003368 RepID=UPI0027351034|nr:alkaline phosphatase D family protein [Limnobacter sp.]MDP3189410.1 alkaline phosphatase D family protein [Limnobacter sp.]
MSSKNRRYAKSMSRRLGQGKLLNRRNFIKTSLIGAGGLGLAGQLASCGSDDAALSARVTAAGNNTQSREIQALALDNIPVEFKHGVASGDPLSDRVIIWTRVNPTQATERAILVTWEMAADPEFSRVVQSGSTRTAALRDFTVKLDVVGLNPYSTYYYRFKSGDAMSPIGRTKTAPTSNETDRIRAAVVACSNYVAGYFNAYGLLARRADLDLVFHLGDYIYETGDAIIRAHRPAREIVSLEDYRERYAQYREDPFLQEAHRQHPWVVTWDDHETTNNSYNDGAENHQPDTEGDWQVRKGQAVRAYFEWMPIRENAISEFDAPEKGLKPEGNGKVFRTIRYGGIATFLVLDTRLAGRVQQNGTAIVSEEQTILGKEQREWLLSEMKNNQAEWTVVAQQMTFGPVKAVPLTDDSGAQYVNSDAWDGYRFDRNAIFDCIEDNDLKNFAVLSGDIHATIAMDLPRDAGLPDGYNPLTGEGSLGVELCCNAVANPGLPIWTAARAVNPHLKHANEVDNGYMLIDITKEALQAEWYYNLIRTIDLTQERPDPVSLRTEAGTNNLQLGVTTEPKSNPPELAPN